MSNVDIAIKFATQSCSVHSALISNDFFGPLNRSERKVVINSLNKEHFIVKEGNLITVVRKNKVSTGFTIMPNVEIDGVYYKKFFAGIVVAPNENVIMLVSLRGVPRRNFGVETFIQAAFSCS